jgi:2-keto-3-deoxy-L-rhamnonate aldolase RhmA
VGRKRRTSAIAAWIILGVTACGVGDPDDDGTAALGQDSDLARATFEHDNVVIDLWADGRAAFGIFVPNERPSTDEQRRSGERPAPVYTKEGGGRLAQNPLYDFLFLNLEGSYDVAAVRAIAEGLHGPSAVARKALLVRIPPIERAGEEVTRARVKEILELGADGVVFPHVRSPEEARMIVGFFAAVGADVWSPMNPSGEILAMIMVEDPGAVAAVAEIADTPGYSMLACGIGSLRAALDGDREAAEAGNQEVLVNARRAGLPDMITANAADIGERVQQGFLALLMQGNEADDVIRIGRAAAGR